MMPVIRILLGFIFVISFPTIGIVSIEATPPGTRTNPARVAVYPMSV